MKRVFNTILKILCVIGVCTTFNGLVWAMRGRSIGYLFVAIGSTAVILTYVVSWLPPRKPKRIRQMKCPCCGQMTDHLSSEQWKPEDIYRLECLDNLSELCKVNKKIQNMEEEHND